MPLFTIVGVIIFVLLTRSFITENGQYTYEEKAALYVSIAIGLFQLAFCIFLDLLLF